MSASKFLFLFIFLSSLLVSAQSRMSINHIVIVSPDLAETVKDYRELGFCVEETGQFGEDFVHNAHVPFISGAYLELFSPGKESTWDDFQKLKGNKQELDRALAGQNAIDKRFLSHLTKPQGIADFAIECDSGATQSKVDELNRAGLKYNGPIKMKRVRPDKTVIEWVVYVPEYEELPFIIEWKTKDKTDTGCAEQEKLEITGIDFVKVAVNDFDKSLQRYTTLLGVEPEISDVQGEIKSEAVFRLKNEAVYIVRPSDGDNRVESYLRGHGQGPYALGLKTKMQNPPMMDKNLLHGADISVNKF